MRSAGVRLYTCFSKLKQSLVFLLNSRYSQFIDLVAFLYFKCTCFKSTTQIEMLRALYPEITE